MYRALLAISRNVYRRHPEELSPTQRLYLREFMALAMLEYEELPDPPKSPGA